MPQLIREIMTQDVVALDATRHVDDAARQMRDEGIGDVLVTFENEVALMDTGASGAEFDPVYPSASILAEPPVAVVDKVVDKKGTRKVAQAYLDYLYSPEGQAIAFRNFYRAWDASAANPEDVARFPQLELVDIAHFGGWAKVQPEHFGDGGVFDQIYVAK